MADRGRGFGDGEETNPVQYNTVEWIEENKQFFLPPVCNKMMHNTGQMKAFFVGGPNQRKDYHIEEGEELFYMLKGDMCLKVLEKGVHRDITIKEGDIFLLPARIPHSPQRQKETVGLVIERERNEHEKDGLRYFIEKDGAPTNKSLYEKWFHCVNLGTQLGPIIKGFFASEQCKTGKPIPGSIPGDPPVKIDQDRTLSDPFNLRRWMDENEKEIESRGFKNIFGNGFQFKVDMLGPGEFDGGCDHAETWIWQFDGTSTVTIDGKDHNLKKNDSLLLPLGVKFKTIRPATARALICFQDPTKK